MADLPPTLGSTSTPRWVKVFGIIIVILILLFIVLKFTGLGGEHGPRRHVPSSSITEQGMQ